MRSHNAVALALLLILPLVTFLSWFFFGPPSPFRPFLRTPAVSRSLNEKKEVAIDDLEQPTTSTTETTTEEPIIDPMFPPGSRPRPLLCPRKLHASGFAAKIHVSSIYPHMHPEVWMWTEQTEKEFRAIYEVTQVGHRCDAAKILVVSRQSWGLTSRMRDVQDIMFLGMMNNKTVVYGASWIHKCPKNRFLDPFMYCFFRNFSHCTSPAIVQCSRRGQCMPTADFVYQDQRLDYIWDRLVQHGLHLDRNWTFHIPEVSVCRSNDVVCDPLPPPLAKDATKRQREQHEEKVKKRRRHYECREQDIPMWRRERQRKMSVLRALLINSAFHPSVEVEDKLAEMRRLMGPVRTPLLVVHARRTDKRYDGSIDRMMPQEMAPRHNDTLVVLLKLVEAAERMAGVHFRSIYFLSDDANLTTDEYALQALSNAGKKRPRVYTTPFNVSKLLNEKYWSGQKESGHLALSPMNRVELNLILLAEIYWAAEQGTYIVGNGRSGVSQYIAQLLGAKYRMDPNWLGLWEDDETLLSCLPETRNISWIIENNNFSWVVENSTEIP